MLTLERIFSSSEFSDEGFDRPRWNQKSTYTTLKRTTFLEISSNESKLTDTTTSDTLEGNKVVFEILMHDAENVRSTFTLVAAKDLIPVGGTTAICIDDYSLSFDGKKVLIFTDSQKVWRLKTRGAYWILDLELVESEGVVLKTS